MSRTKESLTHPEAVEILGDSGADGSLTQAAVDRIEMTLQSGDLDTIRDIGLDLLRIIHPDA